MFREAVMAFLGVKDSESGAQNTEHRRNQGIGEYCKETDIEKCTQYFGTELLKRVCATCPS